MVQTRPSDHGGHGDRTHKRLDARPDDPSGTGPEPPQRGWAASDFITEADAYASHKHVLEDKELRHARQSGRLGFMRRKRTIFYKRAELEAFISNILMQAYIKPCQTISRNSLLSVEADPSLARGQSDVTPDQFRDMLKLFEQPTPTRKK